MSMSWMCAVCPQVWRPLLPMLLGFLVRHLLPESGASTAASSTVGGAGGATGAAGAGAGGAVLAGVSVFGAPGGLSPAGLVHAGTGAPVAAVLSAMPRAGMAVTEATVGAVAFGARLPGPLPLPTLALAIVAAVAVVEHVPTIDTMEPGFTNRLVAALISLGNRPDCPEQVFARALIAAAHCTVLRTDTGAF
jgi:hypothetical protein